ncbi:MAG: hypothetical protein HY303_14695 [Candidatus Wallbacteria bacterium]|nr:hypothetical protein [Candidatus Wallbacteria bacterium]
MGSLALLAGGQAGPGRTLASRLLDKHLKGWIGYSPCGPQDYPNRSWGSPWTAYRSQALAVHAWLAAAASGAPDAVRLRDAARKLRERVLAQCWDPQLGGFCPLAFRMGSGDPQPLPEPGRYVLADQFWALAVFADEPFPYRSSTGGTR